ncbi:nuclear transport factor 2 family protein [Candidatus Binatia bacterium]|nr:nuclear transport factor 2 family protein [Candidatus Binatia bacterium]
MALSPAEMDRVIDEHFGYEASDDVDGVMASLAPDAEHEVVPSPVGALRDPARIRAYYQRLFGAVKGESVTSIRRLYGDDFMVDETLWHGRIEDGSIFLCDGRSGPVSFRLLHVFEFAEGKIAREAAWCDLAAIQRQLGASSER